LEASVTKRDFEHIADMLRRISTGLDRVCQGQIDPMTFRTQFELSFVPLVADELATTNPRFNREKFIQASLG
jgi:hypothetical protein